MDTQTTETAAEIRAAIRALGPRGKCEIVFVMENGGSSFMSLMTRGRRSNQA